MLKSVNCRSVLVMAMYLFIEGTLILVMLPIGSFYGLNQVQAYSEESVFFYKL